LGAGDLEAERVAGLHLPRPCRERLACARAAEVGETGTAKAPETIHQSELLSCGRASYEAGPVGPRLEDPAVYCEGFEHSDLLLPGYLAVLSATM
jgi:hypothetical protein